MALQAAGHVEVPHRVTLVENPEDKFTIVYHCLAYTTDEAFDKAEEAYPGHHMLTAAPDFDLSKEEIKALMS